MLNRITIIGRLTHEPELRHTQSDIPVCSFSIACERDFKDASGNKVTDFIDCVAWRQQATFLSNYLSKGRAIAVEGRLQTRDWKDRDGNKRKSTEIVVDNLYFADSKPKEQQNQETPAADYAAAGAHSGGYGAEGLEDGGDLPF